MPKLALISFLNHSINIRILAAYCRSAGHDAICIFIPDKPEEATARALTVFLQARGIELAGFSLVTDDYPVAAYLTGKIKNYTGIPVIWGGAHVNVMPEESLDHADMICMGEGEEAILELLKSFDNGFVDISIRNIWFKMDNGIKRNPLRPLEENLDKYPFPENDSGCLFILNNGVVEELREGHLQGVYSVMTSRGCPYQCDYCYNSYRKQQYSGLGRYLRMRSVENVIEELKLAIHLFPSLREIHFWDDCFTARNLEELRLFKELYMMHIGLPFFALIEPMIFDGEKIRILKECGLKRLQVGIQTGSERVNREVFNRRASNKKALETAQYINGLGIEVVYDLIFNNPYEYIEDIQETIDLILQFPRPFELQGYSLIFYPGTKITERALNDGYISYNDDRGRSLTIQGNEYSPTAIKGSVKISDRFYKINYSSDDKAYWNKLTLKLASRHFPRIVIRLGNSGTFAGKIIFNYFSRVYEKLAFMYYSHLEPS